MYFSLLFTTPLSFHPSIIVYGFCGVVLREWIELDVDSGTLFLAEFLPWTCCQRHLPLPLLHVREAEHE